MRYYMSEPLLTGYGVYEYEEVGLEEARGWGEGVSAVPSQAMARLVSQVVGRRVPAEKDPVVMREGDEALVVRLAWGYRLSDDVAGQRLDVTELVLGGKVKLGVLRCTR